MQLGVQPALRGGAPDRAIYDLPPGDPRATSLMRAVVFGAPDAVLMDLPQLTDDPARTSAAGRRAPGTLAGWNGGVPSHIRSDNGPEFIAAAVRERIGAVGRQHGLYRARVTLGERLLRELQLQAAGRVLDGEIFYSLAEARIVS